MTIIVIGIMLAVMAIVILKIWADNGYRLSEAEKADKLKYFWKEMKKWR